MTRRRLSQQQLARIRQRQQQARARQDALLGPPRPGLVIAHYGQQLDIEPLDEEGAEPVRCYQRTHLGEVVVGDRVVWRAGSDQGVIESVEARSSLLVRPGYGGQLRPVAANIDRIVLVIAPEPEPHANLIDRYLVAAEHHGIQALLLLNKSDLLSLLPDRGAALQELLEGYAGMGYLTLSTSCTTDQGLAALKQTLAGHTAVLVGQSGVGKSSLANALIPGLAASVGELSTGAAKGRHTTTTSRLHHAPWGADLIDSPGIREFGLGHLQPGQVAAGFRDFQPWLGHCSFRDCSHGAEPGCALRAAVEEGRLRAARLDSYHAIVAELAGLERG